VGDDALCFISWLYLELPKSSSSKRWKVGESLVGDNLIGFSLLMFGDDFVASEFDSDIVTGVISVES
jgi:hypothetical protein